MSSSLQTIILQLQEFWAAYGCLIGQPYYTQVGAGTMNPATFLRVLGPEPWNIGYVEPSIRPDDGRYGENPNRFQQHTQFQVILKPDPGNPVELYIQSLEAIGVNLRQHDIRLVESNWEQPAISAWGLGWEVWLDGQEITQFTYFQQVGGQSLDPVAVEITYGLERILIAINNAAAIWDEPWNDTVNYGEVRRQDEFEQSKYYFETADVIRLRQMYDLYKAEAVACLAQGLVLPAHDYVLKCSHTFNVLDARGAIGVTERQAFFGQMREMARGVAERYLEQRKELEYPLLKRTADHRSSTTVVSPTTILDPSSFLLEIGVEELPASDLHSAIKQLNVNVPKLLDDLHLEHGAVTVTGTPRRLAVMVDSLTPRQSDQEELIKGPPAEKAFAGWISRPIDSTDEARQTESLPYTQAALGFARKNGVEPSALEVREMNGGKYIVAVVKQAGCPTSEILTDSLSKMVAGIKFDKSMRWNASGVAFSRPIRWLVALFGNAVIPFEFAGLTAGRVTRGLRPYGSPEIEIPSAEKYFEIIKKNNIVIDVDVRKALIASGVNQLAASVKGEAIMPAELLAEVANLVEMPTPLLGSFDSEYLALPKEVLISVMMKHQRYFPIQKDGKLLAKFVIIRNGDDQQLDMVREGNEHVVRARFADADFFVRADLKHNLEDHRLRLATLVFQKKLGSMLDKSERIEKLTSALVPMLGLNADEAVFARRAAHLCKSDLVTRMVVEMTSLQGIMGREYALRSGEAPAVAVAIGEQYQPVPKTNPSLAIALADRLDSLTGLFAAGLAPTGTKDPFGLRRAAIGILQPLIEHEIDLDLRAALRLSASLQPISTSDEIISQVLDFISGRLRVVLIDSGYKYDVVDAVLAVQADHPARSAKAIKQLTTWVKRNDWNTVLPAFARCVRITRDQNEAFIVKPEEFIEQAERKLFTSLEQAEKQMCAPGSVDDFLNGFVPMIPAVDKFFEKVLVMAEDKAVQQNRLGLLQRIVALAQGVADISKLEGF